MLIQIRQFEFSFIGFHRNTYFAMLHHMYKDMKKITCKITKKYSLLV